MVYEQKAQAPIQVRAAAVLLFRSISADMMEKINVGLPITHVATGVIKDALL